MPKISHELLARYLTGTSSADEDERVREWLEEHPHERTMLEVGDRVPDDLSDRRNPERFLASMDYLQSERRGRIRSPNRAAAAHVHRNERPATAPALSSSTRTTRAALILLGLVVFVLVVRDSFFGTDDPTVYRTGPGEYTEFTLPDGSEVHLNVASRVELPTAFGTGRRAVRLSGEAYFDVKFDPRQPFVVESADLEVVVLGTAFGVAVYDGDPTASVVVSEGSVSVHAGASEVRLAQGQRAVLVRDSLQTTFVELDDALAWREGVLAFRGTPLDEVARKMQRWYGVAVEVADPSLDTLRLDASFEGESPEDAARAAAVALGIDVEIERGRIVFTEREGA